MSAAVSEAKSYNLHHLARQLISKFVNKNLNPEYALLEATPFTSEGKFEYTNQQESESTYRSVEALKEGNKMVVSGVNSSLWPLTICVNNGNNAWSKLLFMGRS